MSRTTRIAAGALAAATLGLAGAQASALAYCGHGTAAPAAGHPLGVEYMGSTTSPLGVHLHKYRHKTGAVFADHVVWKPC